MTRAEEVDLIYWWENYMYLRNTDSVELLVQHCERAEKQLTIKLLMKPS